MRSFIYNQSKLNMKTLYKSLPTFTAIVCFALFSCKKDDPKPNTTPNYTVPTTYNFENATVNGLAATTRLKMLSVLIEEAEKGNAKGTQVSASVLKDMFENNQTTLPFVSKGISATFSIKDKTDERFYDKFNAFADRLATASQATDSGDVNKAGVMKAKTSTSTKLYDDKGYAPYEILEKGLMGALQYYQITSVLLKDDKIGASVTKDQRQKNWDLAFAYLGINYDYPGLDATPFWGEYIGTIGKILGDNDKTIFEAFRKGRAAINNDDNAAVSSSAATIIKELERSTAGMGLRYLLRAKTYYTSDPVRRNAGLTEGYGFIEGLKYNSSKTISDAEITEIQTLMGDNNWNTSLDNINTAIDKLVNKFGFDLSKF